MVFPAFDEAAVGDVIEAIEISGEGLVVQMKEVQVFGALAMQKKLVSGPEICYNAVSRSNLLEKAWEAWRRNKPRHIRIGGYCHETSIQSPAVRDVGLGPRLRRNDGRRRRGADPVRLGRRSIS